jgi:predicted Zn-dependent protease
MKWFSIPLLLALLPSLGLAVQSSPPASSTSVQVREHERKAHAFLSEHKPMLAFPEFAAVVAADPTNVDAQGNLGVLLYFNNQPAQAEPHLQAALAAQPGLVRMQALLGMCQHRLGQNADAEPNLKAAFGALDDAHVKSEVGLQLIELYTSAGALEKAAALLPALQRAAPADREVIYAAYRVYTDLASERLLDLSLVAPDSAQMHQAIAHEQIRAGDLNGAISNLRKAAALAPTLPAIHYELGEALRTSPDLTLRAGAAAQYEEDLKQNPRDAEAMVRLGDIQADAGDDAAAADEYKRALAAAPQNEDASIGLARTFTERDEPAKAVPLLQAVLADDPTSIDAHFRLSTAYRKLHRMQDAERELKEYQRLKELKDKLSNVYQQLRLDQAGNKGGSDAAVASPR